LNNVREHLIEFQACELSIQIGSHAAHHRTGLIACFGRLLECFTYFLNLRLFCCSSKSLPKTAKETRIKLLFDILLEMLADYLTLRCRETGRQSLAFCH